uniref:Transmembrane protein 45A n=1 Tax=Laticauda laticaudata TaxID=8630 RepID=A0A8C5RZY2_LATLA
MGNFKGHALPGSFFLLFGLWWSVKYPFRYFYQKRKNIYLSSKAGFQRLEFTEAIIKVVFALIGMMAEQFVPDGPHLKLYSNEKKQWNYLMNWQHATMYLFYGISGLVDIVTHSTNLLPEALDRMMLSLAVFVEGFLFYYHIHGRSMLDFHVHQLLLITIFGGALCIFLEVFFHNSIVLEMFRTSLCILHGSWLWQVNMPYSPSHAHRTRSNFLKIPPLFPMHSYKTKTKTQQLLRSEPGSTNEILRQLLKIYWIPIYLLLQPFSASFYLLR